MNALTVHGDSPLLHATPANPHAAAAATVPAAAVPNAAPAAPGPAMRPFAPRSVPNSAETVHYPETP
eukprot:3178201-Alexandrium_andersonii.AAC.1